MPGFGTMFRHSFPGPERFSKEVEAWIFDSVEDEDRLALVSAKVSIAISAAARDMCHGAGKGRSSCQSIAFIQNSYLRQTGTLQAGTMTGRSSKSYNRARLRG
jgi:hypothetical protein